MQEKEGMGQTLHPSQKLTQNSLIDLNVKHTTKRTCRRGEPIEPGRAVEPCNIYGSERPEFPSPDLRSDI